nr:DUF29 domain-containing protein [Sphingomonas sp. ID1715]
MDAYGWAMAQARLLREGRLREIDIENIAEEMESVGRSEKSSAESPLRVLMMHILKWQFQPERRSRSWAASIASQRAEFERVMRDNPSLRPKLDEIRDYAFRRARLEAVRDTDLPLKTFPEVPLDWAVVLNEPFDFDPA